jgi:hypothetical protein
MQINNQELVPIAGFEGRYSITKNGDIYSHKFRKFIHPQPTPKGYMQVCLLNSDGKHYLYVHRIVCYTFNGRPLEGQEVNHINFDRSDNRAENLEWVNHKENILKSWIAGRMSIETRRKGAQAIARIKSKKIYGVDADGGRIYFNSISEAKRHGFSSGRVCLCAHQPGGIHKGYSWFFADENCGE